MEIKSLEGVGFDAVFRAFERAFADYEVQFGRRQVRAMLKRRGFDPRLSFAAFDNGDMVAFTLNGTGYYGGVPTAYDTGTGTVAEYRGRGLAQKIFDYSLPRLRQAGVERCLLEVLQHNAAAVAVYGKAGFEVTREFFYYRCPKADIRHGADVEVCRIAPIGVDEAVSASRFCDFAPSWQNCSDSIVRAGDDLVCAGAFVGRCLAGYCVFEPASGDLTQIAVDPRWRGRGIASRLLRYVSESVECDSIKIINTDVACRSMSEFLAGRNIGVAGRQFEMTRWLR